MSQGSWSQAARGSGGVTGECGQNNGLQEEAERTQEHLGYVNLAPSPRIPPGLNEKWTS